MTAPTSTQLQPQSLDSYLRRRVPACLPGEPSVERIVELTDAVWIIELERNGKVVAKHHVCGRPTADQPDDVLVVEPRLLGLLLAEDCSVPRVLGIDQQTFFIFYEHVGERTVDDLCQELSSDPEARRHLARELVAGFCRIESTLGAYREELEPMVTTTAQLEQLPATAARVEAGALEGLTKLLGHYGVDTTAAALHIQTREISRWLSARAPTLGSTDYNARNIVVDDDGGELPAFIEFARIGWDWPERRLVQYATSLGAGKSDGRFVSLVEPDVVEYYGHCRGCSDVEDRSAALDGHHILFHLNAAAMLLQALDEPHVPRHHALLNAWRNPQQRIAQIVEAIAAPLTDDRLCAEFRESFAVRDFSREICIDE